MDSCKKALPEAYMGKILEVDLSKKTFKSVRLDPEAANLFFGGRGLGAALLFQYFVSLEKDGKYNNAFKDVDPLSEDNILIFSTSPATGTGMPTSGRFHVNFKSPLTEGIGSASSGGKWAVALKKTGYDALQIKGKSREPVWLRISADSIEFRDATHLSSLNVEEITDCLEGESPEGSRIMAIGEAGRKLSLIAAILNDRGRALGRGGSGAVFGSKNLLAIVAVPDAAQRIKVADPDGLRVSDEGGVGYKSRMKLELGKMTRKEQSYGILPSMGTLGVLGMVNNYSELVHNNMRDTKHSIEDIEKISGEALRTHSKRSPLSTAW